MAIVTEPPRVLEIGKKTEVLIEVDEVGGLRTNSMLMEQDGPGQGQRRVRPRDILKLEQKMNCRRNDDKKAFVRGGFGAYD